MKAKNIIISALCVAGVAAAAFGIHQAIWLHDYFKLTPYEIKSTKSKPKLDRSEIKLIAHRGFRAAAPENTLPAYDEAGKAGYWGAECDIYRTKDGVWVLHHDPYTYRMMNGTKNPEKSTYEELLELDYNDGHNIDKYPNLKICTLDEFYQKCVEYNMRAIVEIKYNRSIEYFEEIIEIANKYDVETTYIAFDFEDLERLRELCDFPLYLLVYDIKSSDIKKAKTLENCGISFDGNDKKNLKNDGEMIKKCIDAGLETATWAVDDLELIKTIHSYGTKFITTNSVTY